MSQYPQDPMQNYQYQTQQAPYAMPYMQANRLPTSVKTIAIIGICLGGLTVLNHALGILMFVSMKMPLGGPAFAQYNIINSVVFGSMAILCIIACVGCLMRMEWARKLFLVYCIIYPILLVVSTIVTVGYVVPTLIAPTASSTPNGDARVMGTYVGAIAALFICSILPVFGLVFLRKPEVKAVFASTGV